MSKLDQLEKIIDQVIAEEDWGDFPSTVNDYRTIQRLIAVAKAAKTLEAALKALEDDDPREVHIRSGDDIENNNLGEVKALFPPYLF